MVIPFLFVLIFAFNILRLCFWVSQTFHYCDILIFFYLYTQTKIVLFCINIYTLALFLISICLVSFSFLLLAVFYMFAVSLLYTVCIWIMLFNPFCQYLLIREFNSFIIIVPADIFEFVATILCAYNFILTFLFLFFLSLLGFGFLSSART